MNEESDAEMPTELKSKSALNGPVESGVEVRLQSTSDHPVTEKEEHAKAAHHPSENSPWPIVLAVGMLLVAVGMLNQLLIAAVGVIAILAAIIGWLWQPWVS